MINFDITQMKIKLRIIKIGHISQVIPTEYLLKVVLALEKQMLS